MTTTTTTMRRLLVLRPSTSGRSSSPGRQRQCPLAQLDGALSSDGGGSVLSVRWCADAMRLVRRMQRDLLAVFRTSLSEDAAEVTLDGEGGERLENYMEETAALLDLCNALKSAAARLRRRCMAADFAAGGGDEEEERSARGRSGELREAVEMLGSVVDQVFDELIRGRNEMLGILRDKALA